ncbi:MAG: dTMP kinase, partial [Actinomycetota bacterium]|nr:dTMP kinase [Actinomycetota bacterium]
MDDVKREPQLTREKKYSGIFITFEGIEGSGKTTQAEMLREYLLSIGKDAKLVREPGETLLGEKIREILLDPGHDRILPVPEALLFAADRAQQLKEIIVPALKNGMIVIGDRYTDSSLAYQGVGRGCGLSAIKNLNDWATEGLEPDLTILLDLSAEEGLSRLDPDGKDRIEAESLEFHQNVREAYRTLMKIFSYRIVAVDASPEPEMVHFKVL